MSHVSRSGSDAFLQALDRELSEVGVHGPLRARIVAELADHLACDPDADLGTPAQIARRFADELGTSLARRAMLIAFAALALTGCLFAATAASALGAGVLLGHARPSSHALGAVGALLAVVGAQVALAAGLLGAIKVLRSRNQLVIAHAQAQVVVRRAAVAVIAAIVGTAGLALVAIEFTHGTPAWWRMLTVAAAATSAVALLACAPAVLRASRLLPTAPGSRGDVFDDLGRLTPPAMRGRPWALALGLAAAIAIVLAIQGAVGSDPYDGALRGLSDGAACLAGFALLGRYLGIRG